MGYNSYNAYYLGVQIGIGRGFASLNDLNAWTSLELAKKNAMELNSAGILDSTNLAILTRIDRFVGGSQRALSGDGGLHDILVGITENIGYR